MAKFPRLAERKVLSVISGPLRSPQVHRKFTALQSRENEHRARVLKSLRAGSETNFNWK